MAKEIVARGPRSGKSGYGLGLCTYRVMKGSRVAHQVVTGSRNRFRPACRVVSVEEAGIG